MKTIAEIENDLFEILSKLKDLQYNISKLKGSNPNIPIWDTELELILIDLCEKTKIPAVAIRSKMHDREISEVRQMFFKRAKELTNAPLSKIGRFINRDHATVSYGIKQVDRITSLKRRYNEYFTPKKPEVVEDKKLLVPGGSKFILIDPFKSAYSNIEDSNNKSVMEFQKLIK